MTKPYVPDWGKRLDSSKEDIETQNDPNEDPHPKKHGSLPVTQGPRFIHVPGKPPRQVS